MSCLKPVSHDFIRDLIYLIRALMFGTADIVADKAIDLLHIALLIDKAQPYTRNQVIAIDHKYRVIKQRQTSNGNSCDHENYTLW